MYCPKSWVDPCATLSLAPPNEFSEGHPWQPSGSETWAIGAASEEETVASSPAAKKAVE